jgi:hypothetical protein
MGLEFEVLKHLSVVFSFVALPFIMSVYTVLRDLRISLTPSWPDYYPRGRSPAPAFFCRRHEKDRSKAETTRDKSPQIIQHFPFLSPLSSRHAAEPDC